LLTSRSMRPASASTLDGHNHFLCFSLEASASQR
jgi:hypothetical protein